MKNGFRDGIVDGIPIFLGYITVAITFGILSKNVGITMVDSILFSVLVFAGASQFIALNLLLLGVGVGEIVLTTLLVNFRHFLMSASLATRMTKDMKRWSPLIAFAVTDEVFSVASFKKGPSQLPGFRSGSPSGTAAGCSGQSSARSGPLSRTGVPRA